MTKEEVYVINIEWEKIKFDFNSHKEKDKPEDYGIYQIYGYHPAYGEDSLLYIGKAQNQNFGTRLNERWEFVESGSQPTSIRLGRIMRSSKSGENHTWDIKQWKEMIGIAEMILIKAHSPAMNKQENTGVFVIDKYFDNNHFLIINRNDFGQLLPEVSTLRMSYQFWHFDKAISEDDIGD